MISPESRSIEWIRNVAEEYGFTNVETVDRIYRTDVPKTHAKYHYQVRTIGKTMCLGIDILESEEEVFDIRNSS